MAGQREAEMDLHRVHVDDAFWSVRQKLITDVVIPYQEKILNDAIPGGRRLFAGAAPGSGAGKAGG